MRAYRAAWLVFHTDKVPFNKFACGLGRCGAVLEDRLAVKQRLTTSLCHMTGVMTAAKQELSDSKQRAALDAKLRRAASAAAATAARWATPCASLMLSSFFFFFFWVTGGLSTLSQLMKVPNEPGLSPNNGLENVPLSDQSMASNPRKGQAKCPGAKTTSHDGRAGHVMTHMCHPSKARRMASVTIQVPMQGICTPATRIALWPAG